MVNVRREDMNEEKPILLFQKKVEKETGRIIIPRKFIDEHGFNYYMEVYKDKIILRPIKEEE